MDVWKFMLTLAGIGHLSMGPLIAVLLGVAWMWWLSNRSRWWQLVLAGQIVLTVLLLTVAQIGDDPASVVLDEFVAAGILIYLTNRVWMMAAVVLFIILDHFKPIAGSVEALPYGVGIVGDDVVSALVTVLAVITLQATISQISRTGMKKGK